MTVDRNRIVHPAGATGPSESAAAGGFLGMAITVALLAFAARAWLAITHFSAIGDARVYRTVARNILDNGCISLSDPATAACVAHWGGNQPPGFPALIAGLWAVFGTSEVVIGLAGSLLSALAILRMIQALRELTRSDWAALAGGLLVALSPAHLAWSAHLLTEGLAIATTIWVMAELALSLARGRLQVLSLSLALLAALFIRYDALALGVPVAIVTLMLRPLPASLARAAVVALLVFAPLAAWFSHGLARGLPLPVGRYLVTEDLRPKPMGYMHWVQLWMHDQYEQSDTIWMVYLRDYDQIRFPPRAYATDGERERVEALLAELGAYTQQPFPAHIDAAFAELYAARKSAKPLEAWLVHPAARLGWLWLNPYTSLGWPGLDDATTARLGTAVATREPVRIVAAIAGALADQPVAVLGKLGNAAYRYLLLLATVLALLPLWRYATPDLRRFATAALLYAVVRSVGFALIGPTESRFIVEAFPGLEMLVVLGAFAWQGRPRPMYPA